MKRNGKGSGYVCSLKLLEERWNIHLGKKNIFLLMQDSGFSKPCVVPKKVFACGEGLMRNPLIKPRKST